MKGYWQQRETREILCKILYKKQKCFLKIIQTLPKLVLKNLK